MTTFAGDGRYTARAGKGMPASPRHFTGRVEVS